MTSEEFRHRRLLHKLLKALHKQGEAIAVHTKSDTHSYKPPQTKVIFNHKSDFPPAVTNYYSAENSERNSRKVWGRTKFIIEVAGLLVLGSYVVATWKTFDEIKKQTPLVKKSADAASSQVGIMREQFEASERPWIKLIGIKNAMLSFTGPNVGGTTFGRFGTTDAAWLHVTVEVQNVGHSTAVKVRALTMLVLHQWKDGWGDFAKEQNTVCEAVSNEAGTANDRVLFPGDMYSGFTSGTSQWLTKEHVDTVNGVTVITPAFTGCIDYQFEPFKKHYQTRFAFEVLRFDNRLRFFTLGQDMRMKQLLLVRDEQFDYSN